MPEAPGKDGAGTEAQQQDLNATTQTDATKTTLAAKDSEKAIRTESVSTLARKESSRTLD